MYDNKRNSSDLIKILSTAGEKFETIKKITIDIGIYNDSIDRIAKGIKNMETDKFTAFTHRLETVELI